MGETKCFLDITRTNTNKTVSILMLMCGKHTTGMDEKLGNLDIDWERKPKSIDYMRATVNNNCLF